MKLRIAVLLVVALACLTLPSSGQTVGANSVSVPPVIQFSNLATDATGTPITGTVSITFSLYNGSQGGQPLWTETQIVQLGDAGHYSVYLGLTQANGLPANLFVSGQAQWLGVRIAGEAEQQRVFLVSVPYAMKAGDAATLGGLPPSAFVMAATSSGPSTAAGSTEGNVASGLTPSTNGDVTGLGMVGHIPIWDSSSDIISSVLYQSGSGSTALVGINTTTPATTLDVKGTGTIRGTLSVLGTLSLPATGTGTATAGKDSEPLKQAASAYNSSTGTSVNQTFEWQAEPANNDTSTASGTLNLLFGQGTSKPAETGLHILSNGQITFATGQTFPGTGSGDGTITGVTAGAGLTGGGTSGSVSLGVSSAGITNGMLQNPSLMVSAGTALTGGGTVALGGSTTLNLDTTKVPLLAAANTFTGNQTVNGNVSATGVVTGSGFQIGSNLFAFGSYANNNAFLGFSGNTTSAGGQETATGVRALESGTTGNNNTANGYAALATNTTGSGNTAIGDQTLFESGTGSYNTAIGFETLTKNSTGSNNTAGGTGALGANTTGSDNTALGYGAGPDSTAPALTNSTAIGAFADVTQSNSMVLGGISGVNGCTAANNCAGVNVGIGTTAPAYSLDVHGTGNFTGLVKFASGQTFPGTVTAVNAGTDLTMTSSGSTVTLNMNTTRVPQLAATNTFTGTQSFSSSTGNAVSATTSAAGDSGVFASNTASSGSSYGVFGSDSSPSGTAVAAINYAGSGNAYGVYGQSNSSTGTGVFGTGAIGVSGSGAVGVSGSSSNTSGNGISGTNTATSGTANGVYGTTTSPSGGGIVGANLSAGYQAAGVSGASEQGIGVYGYTLAADSGAGIGVSGYSPSAGGIGVLGTAYGASVTGSGYHSTPNTYENGIGVWGDTKSSDGAYGDPPIGVLATADNAFALLAANNAPASTEDYPPSISTIYAYNSSVAPFGIDIMAASAALVNGTQNLFCEMDNGGDLSCTGDLATTVPVNGEARNVSLYSMQSTEHWFEDFGSGQLENGAATVRFDVTFSQTVNTGVEYHVFLTPRGECEGLYVTAEKADGFEIRELHHGTSNIQFDYRIVAKRKGYENMRLEDRTELFQRLSEQMRRAMKGAQKVSKSNRGMPGTAPANLVRPE